VLLEEALAPWVRLRRKSLPLLTIAVRKLSSSLAKLVQQPRVLNGNDSLRSEILHERASDVSFRHKWPI
jgi:hypothetical protein